MDISKELGENEQASEWEIPTPKNIFPRPCDWRKQEFINWTKLLSQGHVISNFEKDKISNNWIEHYRGIPHRKIIMALQLRANVYPTREFLATGRKDNQLKSCQHCGADTENCSRIISYCPAVQDARIKRHNYLCELLVKEAKKKEWVIFQEPLLRDDNNELYKSDLVFVKGDQALVVDITVRYESKSTSLADAATEKIKKYQH